MFFVLNILTIPMPLWVMIMLYLVRGGSAAVEVPPQLERKKPEGRHPDIPPNSRRGIQIGGGLGVVLGPLLVVYFVLL